MRSLLAVFVLAVSAALAACGGGSSTPPLSAGPIVTQSNLTTTSPQHYSPSLSPGQSITAVFTVQTCHYQQYTGQAAHGQYNLLGCDPPRTPATLQARVNPLLGTNTPCGATAQLTGPGTVVVTKTGPGDPAYHATPYDYCIVVVTDPAISDPSGSSVGLSV